MNLVGSWPNAEQSYYSRISFFGSLFAMIFFINIPQTRMLFLVTYNLNEVIEILTVADLMMLLACFKHVGVWSNKKGKSFHDSSLFFDNSRSLSFLIKKFIIFI